MNCSLAIRFSIIAVLVTSAAAFAQLAIDWSTIDCGGGASAGGVFTLNGTIGQPDAQTPPVMSGGMFTLTGGFWAGTGEVCALPGDLNLDGHVNGADVQGFVNCFLSTGSNCECGDLDNGGSVNEPDVAPFVAALLGN